MSGQDSQESKWPIAANSSTGIIRDTIERVMILLVVTDYPYSFTSPEAVSEWVGFKQ